MGERCSELETTDRKYGTPLGRQPDRGGGQHAVGQRRRTGDAHWRACEDWERHEPEEGGKDQDTQGAEGNGSSVHCIGN